MTHPEEGGRGGGFYRIEILLTAVVLGKAPAESGQSARIHTFFSADPIETHPAISYQ
jgi:hypothetical protein